MLIGTNYDAFAADTYYHRACYNRFTYEYQKKLNTNSNSMPTRNDWDKFLNNEENKGELVKSYYRLL